MNEYKEAELLTELTAALNQMKIADQTIVQMMKTKKEFETELKKMANSLGYIVDIENYRILNIEDAEF